MASDNKILGQFDLVGIPPSARGMPQIDVTFDIDANGIVNVSAKDKATGKEQRIRIQASGGLSDDDIERMVNEAGEHAEEDKKQRQTVEARNAAEALIHSSEKNLKEYGDKVSDDERQAIEDGIKDLKEALEGDDAESITAKTGTLTEATMKLGEAMYKAAQEDTAAGGDDSDDDDAAEGAGGDGSDGAKVVDADFEEVNPEDETKDEVKDGAETDSEDRGDAGSEDGAGEPSDEDADFEDADPDKKKK
jgi:molecular chaperone DnaK